MSVTEPTHEVIAPHELPNFSEIFERLQGSQKELDSARNKLALDSTALRVIISRNPHVFFDVVAYPTKAAIANKNGGLTIVSCTRIVQNPEEDVPRPSSFLQAHVYVQGENTFNFGDLRVNGSEQDNGSGWIIPLHRIVSIEISEFQEPLPPSEE